jgi:uncharacterized membrane-anchored protein
MSTIGRKSGWSRSLAAAVTVAVLQTAILGYLVESRAAILRGGSQVLLKSIPVDPRDLLRGDYVILSYDISSIPAAVVTGDWPQAAQRTRLTVRLSPQPDGFYRVAEAAFGPLTVLPGSVLIESQPFDFDGTRLAGDQSLHVLYGIERYYVPEGEGKVLEEARNAALLSVAVKVSAGGTAQIRTLLLDGKPVYQEPLY